MCVWHILLIKYCALLCFGYFSSSIFDEKVFIQLAFESMRSIIIMIMLIIVKSIYTRHLKAKSLGADCHHL